MARYIDADKLLEKASWLPLAAMPDKFITVKDINSVPTADVVEVVRCEDCKYNMFKQPDETIHCHAEPIGKFRKPNDFCSYGKRRF